jgi:dTDP-4-amino-4,6-dideoxygalactose transaminase
LIDALSMSAKPMQVPFIDLKRQQSFIREQVLEDWRMCLDETAFVGGRFVANLEERLQELLGCSNFVSCANGTDALVLALTASGVKAGDAVAIPDVTFWATYEAVAQIGATAVLIDIDPIDLQMDIEELKAAHEEFHLAAAIPVHLFGWCSRNLTETRNFCIEQGITIIEDAAQAYGVRWQGESIFKAAESATLSFYPAKVIGGCMDGGGIALNSSTTAGTIRRLANHGRSDHYAYDMIGYNSRMGGIQAAYLLRILDRAREIMDSRNEAIEKYRNLFEQAAPQCVKLHVPPEGCQGNGYLLVATVDAGDTEQIARRLADAGVGSSRTYPSPLSTQRPASEARRVSTLQNSATFCKSVINLPLFSGITNTEIEYAAQCFFNAVHVVNEK